MMGDVNYAHPKMELLIFIALSILGSLSILVYSSYSKPEDLYKAAFVIILVFGLMFCFLNPVLSGPDEFEHFIRSEMTSEGILVPTYIDNSYYNTIQSSHDLLGEGSSRIKSGWYRVHPENSTIFNSSLYWNPINYSVNTQFNSSFAQNPFYGYVPQAIGISIAKIFDMDAIWLLWLSRITNLLFYAGIVALAIKKTPILKVPLLVVACMPSMLYYSSTVSIDVMINGLAILLIAYFFYMHSAPKDSLTNKDLIIFFIISLLMVFCKISFLLLPFLIIFVPRENFKDRGYLYCFLGLIILTILAVLWSRYYSVPNYWASHRYYMLTNKDVNMTNQISYMLSNQHDAVISVLHWPIDFCNLIITTFKPLAPKGILSPLYLLFLGGVSLFYPTEKFNIRSRIGALIVFVLLIFETYSIFLLSWTSVGQLFDVHGVQLRYFLPLFALLPFIFSINHKNYLEKIDIDFTIITLMVVFIAIDIIKIGILYY